jgi:hypothetical protein
MSNNPDDGLIPMSRDQKLKKQIGRVVYFCRPPVGDIEADIFEDYGTAEDQAKISKKERMQKQDHTIDTILVGWEGDGVPEFPKDGRPSQDLPLAIKNKLYGWYLDQIQLSIDESKN